MNSIPWNKFATDYDQAFLDAQADYTTEKLDLYNINTQEGRERREQFVSQICGSVRIWRARVDDVNNENSEDGAYADHSLQISLIWDVVILFYSSATEYVVIKMVAAQAVGKCYHFVSLNNIYHLQKKIFKLINYFYSFTFVIG